MALSSSVPSIATAPTAKSGMAGSLLPKQQHAILKKIGFTGPVNIGNPDEFTIKQLAELVIELTGSSSKLIYEDLPQDDPKQRKPDISLAFEKLDGWKPKLELNEGLIKIISYFENVI